MRLVWTDEVLDDLADILVTYLERAGPTTAASIEARIVNQIEALRAFPESIRNSERIPGTRELVIQRLPYICVFHPNLDTDFTRSWTVIPRQAGQSAVAA